MILYKITIRLHPTLRKKTVYITAEDGYEAACRVNRIYSKYPALDILENKIHKYLRKHNGGNKHVARFKEF